MRVGSLLSLAFIDFNRDLTFQLAQCYEVNNTEANLNLTFRCISDAAASDSVSLAIVKNTKY